MHHALFEFFIQMSLESEGKFTSKFSRLPAGRKEFNLKSIQNLFKIWRMLVLNFLAKLES